MYTSPKLLQPFYPPRPKTARKYDYGHLLVIAGSFCYTGAPALVCLAALRAGVDVVTLAAPRRAADIAGTFSPSIISCPLEGDFLMKTHLPILLELAEKKDAIALGPGLGREKETLDTVRALVAAVGIPVVVDADGIFAFAETQNLKLKAQNYNAKLKSKKVIFTPHIRELEILYGKGINTDSLPEKIAIAKKTALQHKATILLKGSIDIITDGVEIALNKTGSPYMTSGGTGDVLCGIVGALATQLHAKNNSKTPSKTSWNFVQTAAAAAWLSGLAGEYAAKKYKDALVATDIIKALPAVIMSIERSQ